MPQPVDTDLLTEVLDPNNCEQEECDKAKGDKVGQHVEVIRALQRDVQDVGARHISHDQVCASQKVEGGETERGQIPTFVDEPNGGYHDAEIKRAHHIEYEEWRSVGWNGEEEGTC